MGEIGHDADCGRSCAELISGTFLNRWYDPHALNYIESRDSAGGRMNRSAVFPAAIVMGCVVTFGVRAGEELSGGERVYENRLTPIAPHPLLADHPEFVESVREVVHFEAPILVNDPGADLNVRTWRFSYNARGIIEIPNRLSGSKTAIVVVHPWGINDGQGWRIPEPAGFAFGTPHQVRIIERHMKNVVNPFLKSLRGQVAAVVFSLPGARDSARAKLYRSVDYTPNAEMRDQGRRELESRLRSFDYRAADIPSEFTVSDEHTVTDYLRNFPGGPSGDAWNGPGFWNLPIPVHAAIETAFEDVVVYDPEGYGPLKEFLVSQGVRHVLLAGYHASMCYCSTTAGYENLEQDFNVFLVGDATLDVHPGTATPRFSTATALCRASVDHLITQVSWIRPIIAQTETAPAKLLSQ